MFTDLKEYQDITKIYNESVNISDEQRAMNKLFAEENINEVLGLKLLAKGAVKANRGILKNIVKGKKFSKTATTAVKDTFKGAKSGIGSMLNKAKPFAKKAAKALGTGLLSGVFLPV